MALCVGIFSRQPGVCNLKGQILPHNAGTHGHHVGVVVLPGHPGRQYIGEKCTADALHLVGGNGYADAGGSFITDFLIKY